MLRQLGATWGETALLIVGSAGEASGPWAVAAQNLAQADRHWSPQSEMVRICLMLDADWCGGPPNNLGLLNNSAFSWVAGLWNSG